MKRNVLWVTVITALLLFITACSNASAGGGGDEGERNNKKDTSVFTKKIGPAGGQINAGDEVIITIPENALSSETEISVKYIGNAKKISEWPSDFIGAVEFGPDGTEFNEPVEVKLKLTDDTSKASVGVFCYDDEEEIWDFVSEAYVEDGYANFNVTHFSIYELQEKFPTKTDKFVELVDIALATGKSDEWIMGQYTDYLINEEKVLEGFKYYEGYWFEPCGIHISGDYCVNGVENQASMYNSVGTSNMVGNKFGFSYIEGGGYDEMVSRRKYKKNKEVATDNQKLYSSYFVIDYQMIEPKIDVTAEKTQLNRGESTKVEVYCHYQGQAMNGYELTLPYILKHFSASVDKVVTDSEGKASFTVKAINRGAERVKVMFCETGYLTGRPEGIAYSAGYEAFTCETKTINISGHVTESLDYDFDVEPYEGYKETKNAGKLRITADYDYDGYIDIIDKETGKVDGMLYFSNPAVDYKTLQQLEFLEEHIDYPPPDYHPVPHECTVTLGLENNKRPTTYYMEYHVSGTIKDNVCQLEYDDILKDLVMFYGVEGKSAWTATCAKGTSNMTNCIFFDLHIGGENKPLYDFVLENGTETINENEFKDDFNETIFGPYYWSECNGGFYGYFSKLKGNLKSSQTTQTITVELPEEDE